MTTAQTGTLVFKDQAGEYYLLPQELLELGRVPEEHTAEIEHLIAEQQDTQGYVTPCGTPTKYDIAVANYGIAVAKLYAVYARIGWI